MLIEKIHIKGFRNFNDTEIIFRKKNLIFGANDIGKTNLLYALRILFDKTISESDLELNDSDYNAYSGSNTIEITATLNDVTEECLLSTFQGHLKDGHTIIRYTNEKDGSYKIYLGFSEATLTEVSSRTYIRRLNMECVDTNRNLFSFLRNERKKLLELAKEKLTPEQLATDSSSITTIQTALDNINKQISDLHYISTSLEQVNSELTQLSAHNEDLSVQFVAGDSNVDRLLNNLTLSYSTTTSPLSIGGDGRNNQIFLSSWIAKQKIQANIDHITIYAIEEPEAHLHPHQQRKLSSYIQEHFDNQIFITSHSPQIAAKFSPANMIRLYQNHKHTLAACGGCSTDIEHSFDNFGYRLNVLSSEIFFSNGIFLVEGVSEVLFYSALAQIMDIDLDRYNISILSVEGVGFKPYLDICTTLNIPYVLRTDNDIFSKPSKKPTHHYFAGITRAIGIVESLPSSPDNAALLPYWHENKHFNNWPIGEDIPTAASNLHAQILKYLLPLGIFLSDVDLETDLANSALSSVLHSHYHTSDITKLIKSMQSKKASNMLAFLTENNSTLSSIREGNLSLPLNHLINLVNERISPRESENAN